MVTALITRPKDEAQETAKLLAAKGFTPLIDPMLTIHYRMDGAAELERTLCYPVQVVVLTSGNGAKALAKITDKRKFPILAIGAATAEMAARMGFENVKTSGGNAQLLLDSVTRDYAPDKGPILYLSGDVMALDIHALLQMQGFNVKRIIGYYAEETAAFSDETTRLLSLNQPAIAVFYSTRTADIFSRLIKKNYLEASLATMTAYALSYTISHTLEALEWKKIIVAEKPTQKSLLGVMESVVL